MAHHQTSRALLILFTFQLFIVSFYANPQTFGPLIRDRAIRDRQQTSEEDLNANIERIYRKDFKTTASPKDHSADEVEPSPTELVARSHAGGPTRPRRPIENNDQNAMVYVIRDADGKLVPMFAEPPSIATTPHTTNTPATQTSTGSNNRPVLKANSASMQDKGGAEFMKVEYPDEYPFDMIKNLLTVHKGSYEHWFEHDLKREPLTTRVNSEGDKFLCSSDTRIEYPTYSEENKRYIVNVEGFYQPVVYETCRNTGSACHKSSTAANYKLICQQTFRDYKMFAVPLSNSTNELDFVDVRLPACCKCAQV